MSEDSQAKKHVAARVPPDTAAEIERLQNDGERSQSEAVRELLRRGTEADRLRRERDSLQNQLNTLAGREREHGELVEYVEEQRSIERRRADRNDRRRSANLLQRAWWFVTGEPDANADGMKVTE
jgi:Arc/MetJ-type ribon-helix-helix transcriptional regulator